MAEVYEFADFRLDVRERVLERGEGGERVPLPDKAFDTLCVLVRNAGKLVEKEELLTSVWADSFVEENNLNKSVHAIRRALGDQNGEPRFVETVKRHGFRFVADVKTVGNFNGRAAAVPGTNGHSHHAAGSEASASESSGRRPETDGWLSRPVLAVFAVIACAAAGFGFYRWFAPASQAPQQFSILVLPVQPLDGNVDEVLKLGIADALIQRLTGPKGVVVRPLSETRKYAGPDRDPMSAGREQKVDYVLASSYQMADGKFRVTGQLINVATARVEETLKSELELAGKFAMQDAVAGDFGGRILKRFGAVPGRTAANRGTSNEEAYAAYLQAKHLLEKAEDGVSAPQAIAAFDRAIALDPGYAAAWAGKGHAHCANSHNSGSSPDEEYKVAEPAVRRALELDPESAEAHVVMGFIASDYHWDFEKSERYFRRALELAPTLDYAHRWYGLSLARSGRVDEGLAHLRQAMNLNPTSADYQLTYGLALFQGGRFGEAEGELERLRERAPDLSWTNAVLWQIYHRKGDGARAYNSLTRFMKANPRGARYIAPFESAYRSGGWAAVLPVYQKLFSENDTGGYWPGHYFLAVLSAYTGDREQAFRSLDNAVKYRLYDVPYMQFDPALEPLRSDPRFDELVSRARSK